MDGPVYGQLTTGVSGGKAGVTKPFECGSTGAAPVQRADAMIGI
jgi:hypothetical protein